MFLGRKQLGQTLVLVLPCVDADGTPTMPTENPFLKVWNASGLVLATNMALVDEVVQPGMFDFPLFLSSLFSAGWHTLDMFFQVGSYFGVKSHTFEVVTGGSGNGAITGMHFYQRPHASFLVQQTESGQLIQGRNPR